MLYQAKLLTSRTIKVRVLDTNDEELALRAIGSNADLGQPIGQKLLAQEMMKMMLVEIDGKPVAYADLMNLGDHFSIKEIRQIETLYQKLHIPTDEETESFFMSIEPVSTMK